MYHYTIGLEVHIKLATQHKLFCRCINEQDFDNLQPNSHICPVCTAQPGALPVLNPEAVDKAIVLGKPLRCKVVSPSTFDRKSYFYPDLPAGYQITQFYHPILQDGVMDFYVNQLQEKKSVKIKEAHIETDTGKMIHVGAESYLDFNRAGTPLIEIVTEPDFNSDDEVTEFLKELQRTIRYHEIGFADLEKGQMRCDVNISVRKDGEEKLGTRVELKNLNSFSAIKRAIHHEFQRQTQLIQSGGSVDQETRGWDDMKTESFVMRSKADALDYRYFPEPDLLPLVLDPKHIAEIQSHVGLNPSDKIQKYKEEYSFNKEFINGLMNDVEINLYFERCVKSGVEPKLAAKRIVGPMAAYLTQQSSALKDLKFSFEDFLLFLNSQQESKLSDNNAKKVFKEMLENGSKFSELLETFSGSASDLDLEKYAQQTLSENAQVVAEYKGGKISAIGFLIGQMMKKTQGKGDPGEVKKVLEKVLG